MVGAWVAGWVGGWVGALDGRVCGWPFLSYLSEAAPGTNTNLPPRHHPTGEKAMEEMNGYELDGRSLNVALGGAKN